MENVLNNIWDWAILGVLLIGAVYTLWIVRQESSTFIDESYLITFGRLSLPVPTWWSITKQEKGLIEFKRTDTRYDWYARFEFIPSDVNAAGYSARQDRGRRT